MKRPWSRPLKAEAGRHGFAGAVRTRVRSAAPVRRPMAADRARLEGRADVRRHKRSHIAPPVNRYAQRQTPQAAWPVRAYAADATPDNAQLIPVGASNPWARTFTPVRARNRTHRCRFCGAPRRITFTPLLGDEAAAGTGRQLVTHRRMIWFAAMRCPNADRRAGRCSSRYANQDGRGDG